MPQIQEQIVEVIEVILQDNVNQCVFLLLNAVLFSSF